MKYSDFKKLVIENMPQKFKSRFMAQKRRAKISHIRQSLYYGRKGRTYKYILYST